jgi:hypothetical protein
MSTETSISGQPATVATLLARAESLYAGAHDAHPLVATAYRRRAAELKFTAWLGALRSGPVPVDAVLAAAPGTTFDAAA